MSEKKVIKGIPVELISFDDETGEICVGDDCFKIRYDPQKNEVAVEIDPDSQSCSILMRKVAKKFIQQVVEEKPKVKFRKV
jgi:hypothetical protein